MDTRYDIHYRAKSKIILLSCAYYTKEDYKMILQASHIVQIFTGHVFAINLHIIIISKIAA